MNNKDSQKRAKTFRNLSIMKKFSEISVYQPSFDNVLKINFKKDVNQGNLKHTCAPPS
jgi:hypothetical protein